MLDAQMYKCTIDWGTCATNFEQQILEATYITSLQSILCRQKEFVYSLQISH